MHFSRFYVLAIVLASATLTACSTAVTDQITEQMIEQNAHGNVDVELNGGAMQVTTSEGTMVMGSGELQAGWPSDVPTYPGANVTYSALVSDGGKPGAAAILQTADSVSDVVAHLQTQLVAEGWTITGTFNAGVTQTIVATKGTRSYSVAVQGGDDGTTMTIGVSEE